MFIAMTNTGAKLIGADASAINVVADALSYDDDSAQRKTGFNVGNLNSRKTFLRLKELVFEAGFVQLVKQRLGESGYAVTVKDMRTDLDARGPAIDLSAPTGKELCDDGIEYPTYGGYLDGIELRDYQANAIEDFVAAKRGIIQAATGSGKTEIGAGIIKRVGRKTLWLTHKIDLVDQTRKRIKKRLGITSGLISEGEWFPSDITIATVQTIMSQMKSDPERVTAFLSSIELLIVDEAHRSSGDGFFSVITNCTGAYYRASLTATPLMKGKQEDDLRLIATSGDIICRITNSDLIRRGILAEPHFVFTQVPSFGFDERKARREAKAKAKAKGRESYGTGAIYQRAYDEGIVNNAYRNNLIVSDAKELVDKGRKTVVLFQRQEHGKLLEDIFIRAGMRVRLVHGVNDLDERNSALNDLRDGFIDVVLASNIFDEGLDEPSISGIVLAGGGKSKISLFQRVGRSVRKKTGDDLEKLGNTAEIRDYIDTGHKNLMKHSALRFHAVKSEDGWIIDQLRMV